MNASATTEKSATPAYVAFPTFKNFLGQLKETGVPGRIDKSVMSNLSGGTQSHLASTLKFLQLVNADLSPTDELRELVRAHGTDDWADLLKPLITERYDEIVNGIDLSNATPHQLDKCFEDIGLKSVMIDKTVRFYLSALEESAVQVSPHFKKRKPKATRRSPAKSKASQAPNVNAAPASTHAEDSPACEPAFVEYPLYLRNGRKGLIRVPSDINEADCDMIELTLPVLKLLAANNAASHDQFDEED